MPNDRTSPLKRCAIYTRKSTNHLLERDVNSLTTQREICSAYVTSQQYRGWIELPHGYDDGGHSGSRLERPALSNLMRDIEAGSVDTVVIYKIDRLTRSLLDFVRLIEIFDRRGVALVSVSQAFDTSDGLVRLSFTARTAPHQRGFRCRPRTQRAIRQMLPLGRYAWSCGR